MSTLVKKRWAMIGAVLRTPTISFFGPAKTEDVIKPTSKYSKKWAHSVDGVNGSTA